MVRFAGAAILLTLAYPSSAGVRLMLVGLALVLLWSSVKAARALTELTVTYLHEIGHGLTALVCRRRWLSFSVREDGSGVANIAGPCFAVYAAGYLAPVVVGTLLVIATERFSDVVRVLVAILGGVVGISSLTHASGNFTRLLGLAFSAALVCVASTGGPTGLNFATGVFGVGLTLWGLRDLAGLISHCEKRGVLTDAHQIAAHLRGTISPKLAALGLCFVGFAIGVAGFVFASSATAPGPVVFTSAASGAVEKSARIGESRARTSV